MHAGCEVDAGLEQTAGRLSRVHCVGETLVAQRCHAKARNERPRAGRSRARRAEAAAATVPGSPGPFEIEIKRSADCIVVKD